MRRVLPAAVLLAAALLTAGCVSSPSRRPLLTPQAQEALLREAAGFSLRGRTAVKAGTESVTASLQWRQRSLESRVRLSGPLGAGTMIVTWNPGTLRIATSRGQQFEGAEAEDLLLRELGYVPPFAALRYWVLGLEAPGEAATERSVAESGRVGEIVQQQWRIRYTEWRRVRAGVSSVQLPRKLIATRDDLRLSVVVDKWTL
jgi:outer membrane lipoprotein LolB